MTPEGPTIAALLTPLAPGAIAVFGLAGPKTDTILNQILPKFRGNVAAQLRYRRPTFCQIVDKGSVVDDAVVVRILRDSMNTAELNTHGGVRIAQRTLILLERCGARIVEGREFHDAISTARSVEREVDHALIDAGSRRLTEWLLCQRRILPPFIERIDSAPEGELLAFHARSETAIRLLSGLRVAIIGPPNAGKSTLANRLIGTDRVITSDQPGTTRDWISETAMIDGWPVTLTDTAGIRETDCHIEAEAIRRSHAQAHLADVILIVVDAAAAGSAQGGRQSGPVKRKTSLGAPPLLAVGDRSRDCSIISGTSFDDIVAALPADRPKLVVCNKTDLPGAQAASHPVIEACPVSALTGDGIENLESRLASMLGLDLLADELPTAFLPGQLE